MTDYTQPTPPGSPAYPPPQPGDDYTHSPYSYYQPQPQRTNGLAIASMVLGIVGILFLWGIGPLLAVIFGYRSRGQIDDSGQYADGTKIEGGRGMSIAGIVLGWIGIALFVLFTTLIAVGAATADNELDQLEDDLGAAPAVTAPGDEPADIPADLPAPEDIVLDVTTLDRQCYDALGVCDVTYEIDMTFVGEIPDSDYRVIYEVDGDTSGPQTGTIDVSGETYWTFEEFAETPLDGELTATATEVRQ